VARLKRLAWHEPSVESAQRLLDRGVHAMLLHGRSGIGKLDFALDLAESLLCERPGAGRMPCGHCAGCALVAARSHPDLQIVRPEALVELDPDRALVPAAESEDEVPAAVPGTEPKSKDAKASREIRIEQVRDLSEWATLTTHRGGSRVIVLEPAEAMNQHAANALLKLLEEPPERTVFLLVSHRVSETLPTIRSRCVLLPLAAPSPEVAAAWLGQQGVAEPGRRLVEAGGAPLTALEPERAALPPELMERLLALLRKGAQLEAAEIVATVPKDVPVPGAVVLFQRWGWDFLAFKLAGSLRYHPEDDNVFRRLAERWRVEGACEWIGELRSARASAEHPLNAKLAIEALLISYARSIRDLP
jgi:DNA polymerase III subunit delta'